MTDVTLLSTSPEETMRIGEFFGGSLEPGCVIVLSGPLGAGKTVLVKGIARALGINVPVVSPSYTIASEYRGDLQLTHIDLYRIGSDEELELLGFDELSSGPGITVIEWGEKAAHFLDENAVRVTISLHGAEKRKIEIDGIAESLAESLARKFAGANQ